MKTEQKHLKSALFVDFDNIYLGLRQLDEDAAEQFASNPAHWLKWMEDGMPGLVEEGQTDEKRDILIRQCYLNPRGFQQYRPYFTRSAFSVVDCPSLTSQGKNSADIYMVMDILDTLNHPTHFDEFIILSGDTDFMPVMLRLREYDRRTTILSAGPAAAAFLAAANLVISEDVFIEHALDEGKEDGRKTSGATVTSTATPELLDAIAEKLYAEASANGEILATYLPKLYRNFPEFRRDSNWLGFFSLRALTTHLTQRNPNLRITEGDPWRVTVALPRSRKKSSRQNNGKSADSSKDEKLRRRIVDLVRRMVANATEPMLMGRAAQEVINRTGKQVLESHWAGAGTFKNLLQSEENLGFEIATPPSPGYLYDPERHSLPSEDETAKKGEEVPPELAEFSKRISRITGAPNLTPRQYAMIFTAMAEDLKEHPYHLTSTSKAIRDRVIEWGEAISRANINNVLKGVAYAKHRFSKRDTPQSLARVYRSYLLSRCEDAELELSREEKRLLREWIEGGLRDLQKKKDEKKNGDAKNGDTAESAKANGSESKKRTRKTSSRKTSDAKKEKKKADEA